jgi:hypothetical protein
VGALGIDGACKACSNLLLQQLFCCSCISLRPGCWHVGMWESEYRAADWLSCEGVVLHPRDSLLLLLLLLLRSL